ncbi:MAG: DUF3084 domain-containing protein [Vulcanimicrobiaceae bacterium]
MGTFGGILSIIGITLIAGGIAYVGDRVGHQVGRRRLTLFGLRPRYTSTVVAIGTGMLIAFAVNLIALLTSNYVRTAFFQVSELRTRVNQLQAQADILDQRAHNTNIVVYKGQLLYDRFLVLTPSQTPAERLKQFSAFFDAVVATLNREYTHGANALKPFSEKSSDKAVRKSLTNTLDSTDFQAELAQGPVIFLSIATENLFPNDPIHFGFQDWPDQLIFHSGQQIAKIGVDGGTTINPNIAFSQLGFLVRDAAVQRGMPAYFAYATPIASETEVKTIVDQIRKGHGRFNIVAKAGQDVYPHLGGFTVTFSLVPATK